MSEESAFSVVLQKDKKTRSSRPLVLLDLLERKVRSFVNEWIRMSSNSSSNLPPLPAGWTQHVAPTGHFYYYNTQTKVSTYDRPLLNTTPEPADTATSAFPTSDTIPASTSADQINANEGHANFERVTAGLTPATSVYIRPDERQRWNDMYTPRAMAAAAAAAVEPQRKKRKKEIPRIRYVECIAVSFSRSIWTCY